MTNRKTFCDGIARRDFLRLGVAGVFGCGLTLPRLLAAETGKTRDVSLIYLYLHGGLSTIDTWDPKPEAPAEFRGDFKTIPTSVPGVHLGEHTPKLGFARRIKERAKRIRAVPQKISRGSTNNHTAPGFGVFCDDLLGEIDQAICVQHIRRRKMRGTLLASAPEDFGQPVQPGIHPLFALFAIVG